MSSQPTQRRFQQSSLAAPCLLRGSLIVGLYRHFWQRFSEARERAHRSLILPQMKSCNFCD